MSIYRHPSEPRAERTFGVPALSDLRLILVFLRRGQGDRVTEAATRTEGKLSKGVLVVTRHPLVHDRRVSSHLILREAVNVLLVLQMSTDKNHRKFKN